MPRGLRGRKGDVLLLVGTRKGAFALSSDASRTDWSLSDPCLEGRSVARLVMSSERGGHRLPGGGGRARVRTREMPRRDRSRVQI